MSTEQVVDAKKTKIDETAAWQLLKDAASIAIAKGTVGNDVPKGMRMNYVDGISGATLTGKYLTAGLKEVLEDYEPVSIRFRKNLIAEPQG